MMEINVGALTLSLEHVSYRYGGPSVLQVMWVGKMLAGMVADFSRIIVCETM